MSQMRLGGVRVGSKASFPLYLRWVRFASGNRHCLPCSDLGQNVAHFAVDPGKVNAPIGAAAVPRRADGLPIRLRAAPGPFPRASDKRTSSQMARFMVFQEATRPASR